MINKLNKKRILVLAAVSLAFLLPNNIALAGFGVSPPQIKEDKLVKGSHFEKTIYLVQGAPKEDLDVEIFVDSPDIAEWITFKDGTEFTIPAGTQQFPFNVTIDVPENADFGIYKAFIRINTKPKLAEGSGEVSVALGGRVDVELVIGDNIISEYIIKAIRILDIQEWDDPMVSVDIKNTGNVAVRPGSASFELFNKYGNVRLAYGESDQFEEVASFSEETIEVSFPVDLKLAIGEYWAHVKIYDEDGLVIKENKTIFNVTKKSFIKKYAKSGTLLLVAILVAVFFKRRFSGLLKK